MTLSPQEQRLQQFCRAFAAIYFVVALLFAAAPGLAFGLATLGGEPALLSPESRYWNAHGVAMLVAMAVSCAVVAGRPRERRHALLPVVAALLTSSGLSLVHGLQLRGPGARALWTTVLFDLPLFLLTLWIYRSAAPGVHSAPATQLPEKAAAPATVQLGTGPKAG